MATPPFAINEAIPADSDNVSAHPTGARAFRDIIESAMAVEHDMKTAGSTARHKFGVGNNAARDAITDWVVGSLWINNTASPATLQRVVSVGPVVWEDVKGSTSGVALLAAANVFTAIPQRITNAAAGNFLELESTDAGSADGPSLNLYRNSATPAANDEGGQIDLTGNSSTGVKRTYGSLDLVILDPTNTSEDGNLRILPIVAGTQVAGVQVANGVLVGAPVSSFKGTGTLNASAGLYIDGHGTVAQQVNDTELLLQTSATTLPFDDTIPQNTEGAEVLSVAITPVNASSVLYIDVQVLVGLSTTNTVTAALFVDTTANALAAAGESVDATTIRTIKFTHQVSAGSTSARTYKVRIGGASGTVSLNGIAGTTQRYGGIASSSIVVTEVLPQ